MATDTAKDIQEAKTHPAVQALCDLLSEKELPVAEVIEAKELKGQAQVALAKAWATGLVEFGRVKHVVTGRPGVVDVSVDEKMRFTSLLIEDGVEWSGPRTASHVRFRDLWEKTRDLPPVDKFRRYVLEKDKETGEEKYKVVVIPKPEAEKLMALQVRLTDRGLDW